MSAHDRSRCVIPSRDETSADLPSLPDALADLQAMFTEIEESWGGCSTRASRAMRVVLGAHLVLEQQLSEVLGPAEDERPDMSLARLVQRMENATLELGEMKDLGPGDPALLAVAERQRESARQLRNAIRVRHGWYALTHAPAPATPPTPTVAPDPAGAAV